MKELTEIVNFVTSVIKAHPDHLKAVLGKQGDKMPVKLFNGILTEQITTDEQAMKLLYGNIPLTGKYRMLKARFKDRLLDMAFLGDTNRLMKTPYSRSLYQAQRNILVAQLLILKDKRQLAVSLLKQALNIALNFQHPAMAVNACRLLCYHEAYSGNDKNLSYYENIYAHQQCLMLKEMELESLYNRIIAKVVLSADYDSSTRQLVSKNFEKATEIYKKYNSYSIVLYYHRFAMRYYHSRGNFEEVIRVCHRFTAYLEANVHLSQPSRAGEFALYEMESCMRLKQFEKGKSCAQRCLDDFTPFKTPWLQFQEYYFLLAMRTGNIRDALEIFNAVTSCSQFKRLPDIQKERWRIHEAYLNFALPDELPKKQFNLFKFLNQVPLSNRDKPGYNFSILLAQVILLININDTDKLINIEFSFREYLRRNIKKSSHPRHYYFGEMLRLFFKNNYSMEGIKEQAAACLKKMNVTQSGQSLEETEIIPYEKLWEMLEEKCKVQLEGGGKSPLKISVKASVKT